MWPEGPQEGYQGIIRVAGGDQKLSLRMLRGKSMGLKGKEAGGRGRAGGDARSKGAEQSPGSPGCRDVQGNPPCPQHPPHNPHRQAGRQIITPSHSQSHPQEKQSEFPASPAPSPGTPTQISARGAPLPGNSRVHMPQQCLIKLPNSKGIPLRLSEDKLGARLLSGNAGTGKEQSLFFFPFRSRITQS